jgi:hypothetical protein
MVLVLGIYGLPVGNNLVVTTTWGPFFYSRVYLLTLIEVHEKYLNTIELINSLLITTGYHV